MQSIGPGGSAVPILIALLVIAVVLVYLPVIIVVLTARNAVCQHAATPAICRWETSELVMAAVAVVTVALPISRVLTSRLIYQFFDHVIGGDADLLLVAATADVLSLLVLIPFLCRRAARH